MILPRFLFDTDVLSEVLKQKNDAVKAHAKTYLENGGVFVFSIITYYEVRRGLLFKDAAGQLGRFEDYCNRGQIIPLNQSIVALASELWARGRKVGRNPPDHDMLIAATAITEGRILVTGNSRDYDWISELDRDDWHVM